MGSRRGPDRGQSTIIGVVLVLALVLAGTTVIVAFAGPDITHTQRTAELKGAEQAMTQFDSEVSLVAHGDPVSKQVYLPTSDSGAVSVDDTAGAMTIYAENATGDVVIDETVTLGAVVYEQGTTKIAYQGGGVWRRDGDGSVMISPPEFDYNVRSGRTPTLTLPLVTIGTSSNSVSGDFRVKQNGETRPLFPTENRENPLEDGIIKVTVQSEYYKAWGTFFENRAEGTVNYDHANEKATIKLVVPRRIGIGQGIGTGAATLSLQNSGRIDSYDSREAPYSSPGEANAIVAIDGNVKATNAVTVKGTVRSTGYADIDNNINVSGPFIVAGYTDIDASPEFGGVYSTGGDMAVDASKAQFKDDVIVGGDVTEFKNGNAGINGTLYVGGNVVMNRNLVETDLIANGDVTLESSSGNEVRGTTYAGGSVTVIGSAEVHDINATDRVVIDGATVDGDVRTTGEIELVNGATITGDAVAGNDMDADGNAIEMDSTSVIQGDAYGDAVDDETGTVNGNVEEDPANIPDPAATVVIPSAPLDPEVSIPADVNDIITGQDGLVDDAENDNDDEDDIDEATDQFTGGSPYTIESGSYYLNSPSLGSGDDLTFDTTGGDVDIYVDGTFGISGADIDIVGDGKVKIYMDDDLDYVGGATIDAPEDSAKQFYVFMRPNGTADFDGNSVFMGALYGPRSATEDGVDITINNNIEIFGGVVGNVQATSNGNEVHYDEALNDPLLIGGAGVPRVTYLHISVTEVRLED